MKTTEFRSWMEALNLMSRGQRDMLRDQLQEMKMGDEGAKLIEQSLSAEPACPHCASSLSDMMLNHPSFLASRKNLFSIS